MVCVELGLLDNSGGQAELVQLDLHEGEALDKLGQLAFSVEAVLYLEGHD